jgi:CDGSH-type Zn-finger protein/uncharacterized Fe-S cluster protein YjdI
MSGKVHRYEDGGIAVLYDVKRCIHAAECVRGLPGVFDPNRRPWADPSQASASELAETIARCPTGALGLEGVDAAETSSSEDNVVSVQADGPLFLRGRLELGLASGEALRETRMALCRCGDSENKPFCDNSHLEAGFRESGKLAENRLAASNAEPGEIPLLEVSLVPNGPVLLEGEVELVSADGGATCSGRKGALCRCGASRSKPFCDGSHTVIGFEAD